MDEQSAPEEVCGTRSIKRYDIIDVDDLRRAAERAGAYVRR